MDFSTLNWADIGKIIWMACLILWAVLRYKPNRAARKIKIAHTNRSARERFSMLASITGLGIIPAIWVFSGLPTALDRAIGPVSVIIGTIIFALSLYLFRRTHKALGKMWSHSLDLRENHKLVSEGIYRQVRHPMYTAFWLWALAQPFLLANWLAGFAGIAGFGTLYFLRVGLEEKMMETRFGEEYREYIKRTKRLIPGLY